MIHLISRLFCLDYRIRLNGTGITATCFLTLFLVCGWAAAGSHPPEYQMQLSNGEKEIGELTIGDDLWVSADSLPRNMEVKIELVDEIGGEVSVVDVDTGPLGVVESSLLWFRSGVVGCDPSSHVDPLRFRFMDFPQAEVFLKDRSFTARIVDSNGWRLVERTLPLSISAQTRYFFSDHQGCPRSEFEFEEDVFLSAVGSNPRNRNTAIFFVESEDPVSVDGLILEVREHFRDRPQVLSPEEATGDWTVLIWDGADSVPGLYGGFVRLVSGDVDPRWDPQADESLGILWDFDNRGPHGITIKTWSCPVDDDLCNRR